MVFSDIKGLLLLLIICLPLSVKTTLPETDTMIFIPSEIIAGVLFTIYLLRYVTGKQKFDPAFFFHPVTVCILLFLCFSIMALLFSSMMVVSLKAMVVKIVYIGVYYFLLHEITKEMQSKGLSLFVYYGFALILVVFYNLYNHSNFQFSIETSGAVSLPFYSDHTIYSACLAFVFPSFVMLLFKKEKPTSVYFLKTIYLIASIVIITGIFFSFCRATWLSLAAGFVMFILLLLKVKPVQLLIGILGIGILAAISHEKIIDSFKQNHYDSNAPGAGLAEQTKSITNISNDQSNAERLNRWKCAIRMFEEKPWAGFGPGTYQFQYLAFQKPGDMTRISVRDPLKIIQGHGGSAHSEYLLVLSESGIFAFLSFIGIIIYTLIKAIKNAGTSVKSDKNLCFAILIGLITYLVHGLFNNFLDTDKTAFLFWGAISILTTLDISLRQKHHVPVITQEFHKTGKKDD